VSGVVGEEEEEEAEEVGELNSWCERCSLLHREGRYFEPILNYMRTGELLIPPSMPKSAVLAEADFYCITPG
jgi:hypothetical protein